MLHITVTFPDLKELYFKTQSRVGRHSRQRVVKGKIKVCVATGGHQVQTIEVYVERTPDAAHLVGDRCGRVYLKPQPGPYFSSKVKKNSVTCVLRLREQTPGSVHYGPRVIICSNYSGTPLYHGTEKMLTAKIFVIAGLACVAWRFLSNLRALGKRESRDKKRQSREEPGRETTIFAASPLCVSFKLAKTVKLRRL